MARSSGRTNPGYDKVPLLSGADSDSGDDEVFNIHPPNARKPNGDKMSKVRHELNGAINVMKDNLNKVLDRGDKLEDLEAKSESFEMNAFNFKAGSTRLRQKLWWQNCKMKLLLVGIVAVCLLVIIIPIVLKKKKH